MPDTPASAVNESPTRFTVSPVSPLAAIRSAIESE
jgi:hypothetical protein